MAKKLLSARARVTHAHVARTRGLCPCPVCGLAPFPTMYLGKCIYNCSSGPMGQPCDHHLQSGGWLPLQAARVAWNRMVQAIHDRCAKVQPASTGGK